MSSKCWWISQCLALQGSMQGLQPHVCSFWGQIDPKALSALHCRANSSHLSDPWRQHVSCCPAACLKSPAAVQSALWCRARG